MTINFLDEAIRFAKKLLTLLLIGLLFTGLLTQAAEDSTENGDEDEFTTQLMDPETDASQKRQILYQIRSRESKKLYEKQRAFIEQMLRKIDESFKQKYANAKSAEAQKLIDKARYKARDQFFKLFHKESAKIFEQLDQTLKSLADATYRAGEIDLSQFGKLKNFSQEHEFNLAEEVLKLIFPDLAEQQSQGEDDMSEYDMSENGMSEDSISEDDMTSVEYGGEYSDEMEEGFTEDQPSASEEDQVQSTDFESQANEESEYNGNMVTRKFIAAIEKCQVYEESFRHIFTGETLKRFIHGIKNNRCVYEEQMPNGGLMTCHYSLKRLPDIAWFYAHPEAFENMQVSSHTEFVDGKPVTTNRVTVNGKEVKHALSEALEQGECEITGYSS